MRSLRLNAIRHCAKMFTPPSAGFFIALAPGDEFEIKLGKKAIRLIPVGGEEEGEE